MNELNCEQPELSSNSIRQRIFFAAAQENITGQVILAEKVTVNGCLADPCRVGDVAHTGCIDALFGEQGSCRPHDGGSLGLGLFLQRLQFVSERPLTDFCNGSNPRTGKYNRNCRRGDRKRDERKKNLSKAPSPNT